MATAPAEGFPALEALTDVAARDADVRRRLRQNLARARLTRADAARTADLARYVAEG